MRQPLLSRLFLRGLTSGLFMFTKLPRIGKIILMTDPVDTVNSVLNSGIEEFNTSFCHAAVVACLAVQFVLRNLSHDCVLSPRWVDLFIYKCDGLGSLGIEVQE